MLGEHPEVSALGVAERARRRGVGTALMGAAAGVAREQGAGLVGLAVEPDNEAATTLYRRLGWQSDTDLAPIDEWSWVDERGVEHEERDRCQYWSLALSGDRHAGRGR